VAEERQDDDEAVEELYIEAAEARADDPGLDERNRERADGPPPQCLNLAALAIFGI
jgi:hypothetical protein